MVEARRRGAGGGGGGGHAAAAAAAAAAAGLDSLQVPQTHLVKPMTRKGKRALEKRAPKLVRVCTWPLLIIRWRLGHSRPSR
jgi:hypothetical protein